MLPPVSEPSEKTHSEAATAAAGPPLLPPGTREVSHGFFVDFNAEFSVEDPMANSSRFPLPSKTEFSLFNNEETEASNGGIKFSSILEEQVVGIPE